MWHDPPPKRDEITTTSLHVSKRSGSQEVGPQRLKTKGLSDPLWKGKLVKAALHVAPRGVEKSTRLEADAGERLGTGQRAMCGRCEVDVAAAGVTDQPQSSTFFVHKKGTCRLKAGPLFADASLEEQGHEVAIRLPRRGQERIQGRFGRRVLHQNCDLFRTAPEVGTHFQKCLQLGVGH